MKKNFKRYSNFASLRFASFRFASPPSPPLHSSTRLGSARLGSARLGSARLGSARLGSARLGSARLGSARLGSARLAATHPTSHHLIHIVVVCLCCAYGATIRKYQLDTFTLMKKHYNFCSSNGEVLLTMPMNTSRPSPKSQDERMRLANTA